jgi:mRNA m6A methyltransferase non-catalytic subunit
MAAELGHRSRARAALRRVSSIPFRPSEPNTVHNYIRYPKQQRLLNLKKESVDTHAAPSCYLPLQNLPSLHPSKFDVILVDPPFSSSFGWDELQEFPIPSLAADPSFIFMWVGSGAGEGLERGREVLAKWGYRRCEDVVWVKTNAHANRGPGVSLSLLTFVKTIPRTHRQIHLRRPC